MKERLWRFRSFWIFPLLGLALLFLTRGEAQQGRLRELVWLVPVGLFSWTLLEYFFHRVLFHADFRNPLLRELVNVSHLKHHAAPRDAKQILVIPSFALVISAGLFTFLAAATRNLFTTSAIITGIWLGFLYYEAVHYRVHMSLVHSALLQQQRRAHFYHHFSDSEKCFGVTSPLWDYVFRTNR